MSEKISTYSQDDKNTAKPMDRNVFYDEQVALFKQGKKPERAVGLFDVLLFTPKGEIILQKRSHKKRHNPYLIDKAVGGHIQYGDSPYYTAMIECVQELRVPAVVLREDEDFRRTYEVLDRSLENTAILELVDHNMYEIENVMNEERVPILKNIWMFVGLYSGAIKPVDGEATGILYYEMDILKDEMKRMPELFTPDLHFMMKKYNKDIERVLAILK